MATIDFMAEQNKRVVRELLELHKRYSWNDISHELGIPRSTLYRYRTTNANYQSTPIVSDIASIHQFWKDEFEPKQSFVPLLWKWNQDDGSTTTMPLQIPIEVWQSGLRGPNGIADYVTSQFALDWAKRKEDPIMAQTRYYTDHIHGFTEALENAIRSAYNRRAAMKS